MLSLVQSQTDWSKYNINRNKLYASGEGITSTKGLKEYNILTGLVLSNNLIAE